MLDINIMGPALVAKHVVPAIRQAGGGSIVNLASISSFIAQPNYVTYNTTKAAILGMTRCMAMDLAPDNIRVNSVCPGVVWTQIVEKQAKAMGLDKAAADVHPAMGRRSVDPALCRPSRDRARHSVPRVGRRILHHRLPLDGGRRIHSQVISSSLDMKINNQRKVIRGFASKPGVNDSCVANLERTSHKSFVERNDRPVSRK